MFKDKLQLVRKTTASRLFVGFLDSSPTFFGLKRKRPGLLKVLFDGNILSKFGKWNFTGIPRVADRLFRSLMSRKDIDLYFLVSSLGKGADKYAESVGFDKSKFVYMPLLQHTAKSATLKHRIIYGKLLRSFVGRKYGRMLKNFDVYFSSYWAISPIVYDSGIKTACYVYDMIPLLYPNLVKNPRVIRTYPNYIGGIRTNLAFFDSNSAREDFLRLRLDFPAEKAIVVYPGVDMKRTEKRIEKGNYILAFDDGNPRKNFPHIQAAFAKFSEKNKGMRLVVVGSAHRYVPDPELSALYSGASALLYPSLYEGFGLPPLEAMACGTPAIAGDNSSMPEVCGDAALYVSGFDVDETARAIKDAIGNKKLVAQGLKRAALFSWDKMADQIVEKLKELK